LADLAAALLGTQSRCCIATRAGGSGPRDRSPVILPEDVAITMTGGSPLARVERFAKADCPSCGRPARRETDTMDTSWIPPGISCGSPVRTRAPGAGRRQGASWMPWTSTSRHRARVLHLLYARFFTKVCRDLGLSPVGEPFTNLLTQAWSARVVPVSDHGYRLPGEVTVEPVRECSSPWRSAGPRRCRNRNETWSIRMTC